MTVADVKKLPVEEKLRLMEALWLDLREHADQAEIPEAHRKLLDERRARGRGDPCGTGRGRAAAGLRSRVAGAVSRGTA